MDHSNALIVETVFRGVGGGGGGGGGLHFYTYPGFFSSDYQDVWAGIHVKDDRLVWHSYGPEYVKRRKYDSL